MQLLNRTQVLFDIARWRVRYVSYGISTIINYGEKAKNKINLAFFILYFSILPKSLIKKGFSKGFFGRFNQHLMEKGYKIRINKKWYYLVDGESLVILNPNVESAFWRYFNPTEGDVVFDVGANIGKYTFRLAELVKNNGVVMAFEPLPKNYRAIEQGIKTNYCTNIRLTKTAVWNRNCTLNFFIGDESAQSSLKENAGVGHIAVNAEKIDTITKNQGLSHVDWIKIDVEGAELEALQGAEQVLRTFKPKVMVEVRKENEQKVFQFLKNVGYEYLSIDGGWDYFCQALN
jgi:FkbM family methyltransferase